MNANDPPCKVHATPHSNLRMLPEKISYPGLLFPKAGTFASEVVAAIAAVELPVNHQGDLIEMLLGFVNIQTNVNLRIATLQSISFICKSIKPEILTLRANEILTAVIHGVPKEEGLLRSNPKFISRRSGRRIRVSVRIMGLYYDKWPFIWNKRCLGRLISIQLTVVGMKHPDERVALQVVEFWSTVCEEEVHLAIEAQEAQEYGELPETESKHFAKIALPKIVPMLLLLMKQEELADKWNISIAAGTCLSLLAGAVEDAIAHIKSTDWHHCEAAVITFGSILEGPDPIVLTPLTAQAFPLLINMMTDTNTNVKDTVAWTLVRICNLLIQTIAPASPEPCGHLDKEENKSLSVSGLCDQSSCAVGTVVCSFEAYPVYMDAEQKAHWRDVSESDTSGGNSSALKHSVEVYQFIWMWNKKYVGAMCQSPAHKVVIALHQTHL
ncbi:armadillo-type protein [Mycena olivaceomarginata]|nr:armadillo-type protein [Mycena olivaceomarginata]